MPTNDYNHAGSDRYRLDDAGVLSIFLSAGIFATTIQAQDFKDVVGDKLIGRQTLPIIFPSYSRYTVIVGLLAWTATLSQIWHLDHLVAVIFFALAIYVGMRFLKYEGVHDDQVSFYFYNVRHTFYLLTIISLTSIKYCIGLAIRCAYPSGLLAFRRHSAGVCDYVEVLDSTTEDNVDVVRICL